jgi:hypothetical protein
MRSMLAAWERRYIGSIIYIIHISFLLLMRMWKDHDMHTGSQDTIRHTTGMFDCLGGLRVQQGMFVYLELVRPGWVRILFVCLYKWIRLPCIEHVVTLPPNLPPALLIHIPSNTSLAWADHRHEAGDRWCRCHCRRWYIGSSIICTIHIIPIVDGHVRRLRYAYGQPRHDTTRVKTERLLSTDNVITAWN